MEIDSEIEQNKEIMDDFIEDVYKRQPKALAEEYGLPWNSLAHYIQRCKTVEEAVDRCKEAQEKKIMLWGKRYQSRYEVATAFGIRETSISARIHTRNRTLEEIVLELLQKEPICFERKTYNTLVELCAEYQVQPCNVCERLKYGKTLEEAIYLPIRNNGKRYEIVYEGKVYQNAAFLCREYNISYKYQSCPRYNCRQKRMHQCQINHRHFINNNHIRFKGILPIS